MVDNRFKTFTDRREAIALFEYLRGRDPSKPWPLLPILVFFAWGGSGKSKLIDYLRTEICSWDDGQVAIPHAQIDFTQPGAPKTTLEILVTLRNILTQQHDEEGKYLTFPRFDLGASIVSAVQTEGNSSLLSAKEVESCLDGGARLLESLTDMGGAVADIADLIPAPLDKISKVIRALLAGLKLTAQIPAVKRLMQRIESGPGWRWYQTSTSDPGLQATAGIHDVLLRLQFLSIPGSPGQDYLTKEVLPAAFLADLLAALVDSDPPRAWRKAANVVLFLDGFEDLLDDLETSSMAIQLLESLTLSEHRISGVNDPLLVVIGSRPSSFLKFANLSPRISVEQQTVTQTEPDITKHVRELYESWRQKLPKDRRGLGLADLYLPWPLQDFGWEDAQQYLLDLGQERQKQIFADRKLVEAIYQITHGHPLSLALAAAAFLRADDRDNKLSVDKFVEEFVAREVVPGHEHESIRAYLLDLFLRQLTVSERRDLIFCAVPRFLDAGMVRTILQLSTDAEAQDYWDRYQDLTFVSVVNNERIIFHPLVRSLLLQRLHPTHEPVSDYHRTHTRLYEYFHAWTIKGNEQARIEEAYHAMALGNLDPAVETGVYAQRVNSALWEELLKAVAQAPTTLRSADMEQQLEYRRPNHDLQQGVRAMILHSWLLPTFHAVPEKTALLQRNIGRIYCDLQGADQQANLWKAIDHYKIALEGYRENSPAEWATTQLDLGEAYSLLRGTDRRATKRLALACYKAAQQVCTEQASPTEWARAENNRGEALSDIPGEDQRANLLEAIRSYKNALRIRTQKEFPFEWAITRNNLGNAYSHLPVGNQKAERQKNLGEARQCHLDALEVHTKEKHPVEWARAWNNLGNAYRNLAENLTEEDQKAERQKNLEEARKCYERALESRTQQDHPVDWAATQRNLGHTYRLLSGISRSHDEKEFVEQQQNFRKAEDYYNLALEVYTKEAYPMDWAKTKSALGTAYRYKPERKGEKEKKRVNQQQAIVYYEEALQVYTREGFPKEWAQMWYYLGLGYAFMPGTPGAPEKELEDQYNNLEQAVACYEEALKVYVQKDYPEDWAKVQRAKENAQRLSDIAHHRLTKLRSH